MLLIANNEDMNYLTGTVINGNDMIYKGLVEISHNIMYIKEIRATILG
jgi:hypothetical protein